MTQTVSPSTFYRRPWVLATLGLALGAALLFAGTSAVLAQADIPTFPELQEGEKLIERQRWEDAEKWFYKFTKANPQHAEALRKLGFVELNRRPAGDMKKALNALVRARSIEPNQPVGVLLLAKAEHMSGNEKRAIELYDAMIEAGPGERDAVRRGALHFARFNRGMIAVDRGDVDLAKEQLTKVLRREPSHAFAKYELARLTHVSGDADEALKLYDEAAANLDEWAPVEFWPYPQGRYAYLRDNVKLFKAQILMERGYHERALETIEPLVEFCRARSGAKTSNLQGYLLYGESVTSFENAPFYWAEILSAMGRDKDAKKAYKEFVRLKLGDEGLREEAKQLAKK